MSKHQIKAAGEMIVRRFFDHYRREHPDDIRPDAEVAAGAIFELEMVGPDLIVNVSWPDASA